jgi:spoIIIJ-associated protein
MRPDGRARWAGRGRSTGSDPVWRSPCALRGDDGLGHQEGSSVSETQQTSVAAEDSVAYAGINQAGLNAEDLPDQTPEDVEAPVADTESDGDEDESSEDEEGVETEDDAPGSGRGGRRWGGESLRRLEEEGEVAADYLEELLDIVDLDGDIDIDVENGRASVAILTEAGSERELRRLVGAHGEVLEALQELARLAVQARTGDRSRLMLDVAGFRAARRRTLEDLAARVCQEVRSSGEPTRMDPMSPFERKVVHDVVATAGLISESEGEEPSRRVVVLPAAS